MRSLCVLAVGLVAACSGHDTSERVDAGAADAALLGETCETCTQILLVTSAALLDVQGDGTNLYVLSGHAPSRDLMTLSEITPDGQQQSLATSWLIQLFPTTSGDAVLYAVWSAASTGVELHLHTGANDQLLGRFTSDAQLNVAGNATDVYAFVNDVGGTSTLWRMSRAGGAPIGVATLNGTSRGFALGATRAAIATSDDAAFVALPGPSAPSSVGQGAFGLSFTMMGDTPISLTIDDLNNTTAHIVFASEPGHQVLYQFDKHDGGLAYVTSDARHAYWVEGTRACKGLTCMSDSQLWRSDLSLQDAAAIATFPTSALGQDATHLYGLEQRSEGHWLIDVLAK